MLDHLFESPDEERERETVDGLAEGLDYQLGAETCAKNEGPSPGITSSSHSPGACRPLRASGRGSHPTPIGRAA